MEIIKKILKSRKWLLLLVIPILSGGCKKDNVSSDPFAGLNNQLVCKVDGSEWRSNDNRYSGFYDLNPFVNQKYIYLEYRNGRQAIQFHINPPYRSGKIYLNHDTNPYSTSPDDYGSFVNEYPDLTPNDLYVTNSIDTGTIDILTIDSINKKIKAKFSFIGKDSRSGKKITITDGYFEYHQ